MLYSAAKSMLAIAPVRRAVMTGVITFGITWRTHASIAGKAALLLGAKQRRCDSRRTSSCIYSFVGVQLIAYVMMAHVHAHQFLCCPIFTGCSSLTNLLS